MKYHTKTHMKTRMKTHMKVHMKIPMRIQLKMTMTMASVRIAIRVMKQKKRIHTKEVSIILLLKQLVLLISIPLLRNLIFLLMNQWKRIQINEAIILQDLMDQWERIHMKEVAMILLLQQLVLLISIPLLRNLIFLLMNQRKRIQINEAIILQDLMD